MPPLKFAAKHSRAAGKQFKEAAERWADWLFSTMEKIGGI